MALSFTTAHAWSPLDNAALLVPVVPSEFGGKDVVELSAAEIETRLTAVFDRLGPARVRAGARSFGRETGGGWYDCFWAMVYGEAGDLARVVNDERNRFAAAYPAYRVPARSHAGVIMETFDLTLLDVAMLVLLFDSCNSYLADRVSAWLVAREPAQPPNQSPRQPWRSPAAPLPYVSMPAKSVTVGKSVTFAECLVAEGAPWQQ